MLRDDDAFPMPLQSVSPPADHLDDEVIAEQHLNDDFDDVFGSAPPSPSSPPGSPSRPNHERGTNGNEEFSDIPRLKEKHETEGYRDGVTKGKAESVQAGFDEGYSLGAVLGLKIGKILGLLEGISSAIDSCEGKEWERERARVSELLDGARRELRTESVFGKEWWGEDGVWRFDVPGDGEGEGEVSFEDVAGAHPLVRKWMGVIDEEVERWGLDLGIMDGEGEDDELKDEVKKERKSARTTKEVASEPVAGGREIMGVKNADLNW